MKEPDNERNRSKKYQISTGVELQVCDDDDDDDDKLWERSVGFKTLV